MIDSKSEAQSPDRISDDDLDIVRGGVRKAGGGQQEYMGDDVKPPPTTMLDWLIGWVKGHT